MPDELKPDSDEIHVTLRIPGMWSGPQEFVQALPKGCRCNGEALKLADGTEFEFNALPADNEFAEVFANSCPKRPTDDEIERIENYKVNACISGPGGSLAAAKKLMAGAAAILAAGGAGVFIDNCGLAHGATDWLALQKSADNGGVYWAFVTTVRSEQVLYSIGMHVLGFREALMPLLKTQEQTYTALHSFLGYSAFSGAKINDGDVITDPVLPALRVRSEPHDRFAAGTPMFNPFGQWRLELVDVGQN
jgi:hypothetical protein